MSIDELLRAAAEDVAARTMPGPPDVESIRRQGRRLRRLRLTMVGAAAAALIVIAGVVAGGLNPAADPEPADAPDAVTVIDDFVWFGEDGIHFGEDVVELAEAGELRGMALVRTGVVYSVGRAIYYQTPDGDPVRIGDSRFAPAADPNGSIAAWFDGHKLMVFDTEALTAVGGGRFTERASSSDPWHSPILLVSHDRVVFEAGGEVWEFRWDTEGGCGNEDWSTGCPPSQLAVTSDELLDSTGEIHAIAEDPVVDEATDALALAHVRFESDGQVLARYARPIFREGAFSAAGLYFAASTGYTDGHQLVVIDPHSGEFLPLRLPDLELGAYALPFSWSYGDRLLVEMGGSASDQIELVGCEVSEGTCEVLTDTDERPLSWH